MRDVTINPDDAAIVAAITAMGLSLRMSVAAERVATAEQVSFLLRHQIDLMQGHYFCRPVPEEACARLIEARKITAAPRRAPLPKRPAPRGWPRRLSGGTPRDPRGAAS